MMRIMRKAKEAGGSASQPAHSENSLFEYFDCVMLFLISFNNDPVHAVNMNLLLGA